MQDQASSEELLCCFICEVTIPFPAGCRLCLQLVQSPRKEGRKSSLRASLGASLRDGRKEGLDCRGRDCARACLERSEDGVCGGSQPLAEVFSQLCTQLFSPL